MAEILGVGLSHYPPLCMLNEEMTMPLTWTLDDPDIPAEEKNPANWTQTARTEWSNDQGAEAAIIHREMLVQGFDRIRQTIDDFNPDAIVIWGDDQYENFREDIIPPFSICAYEDMEIYPWANAHGSSAMVDRENIWGESEDYSRLIRGRSDIAKHLVTGLLERHIDVSYSYKPLHQKGLAHAFLNAILFLDYHRTGFDYPIIPFPLNCYGRRVISCKGFLSRLGIPVDFDPPSPSPARFMEVGAATARVFAESPWRIVLMASSSWSHAFLCDKTYRLRPDIPSDRRLYEALQNQHYEAWRETSLEEVEAAGQHEVLNWFALAGAMEELGATPHWGEFVETEIFNSNKVFFEYEVV